MDENERFAKLVRKQEKIAEEWWEKRVTQQAVAQHLARAGWYSVEKGIQLFEQSLGVELSNIQAK